MRPVIALGALLAGCGGPAMAAYTPAEKKTDLAPDALYAAAEGALLDAGYLIETRDPAGHRLETQERTMAGSEIKQDKYRYRWTVETAGGTLKLRVSCERVSGDDGEDCGGERPEKLVKEQDRLIEQIVSEAKSQ